MTSPQPIASPDKGPSDPRNRGYLPTLLIVLAGLIMTLVAFQSVREWERAALDAEFQRRAHNHALVLQTSIDRNVERLESIASLYSASEEVDRDEFRRFVEPLLERHPEVQAYSWNPLVKGGDRVTVENAARADGLPDYRITEVDAAGNKVPAGRRDEYVPVHYIEPLTGNAGALGYNIASEATRREALAQARELGQATTRWVRLIQEQGRQYGILVARAIYASDGPARAATGPREALLGYVVGVFRVGEMIEEALRPADLAGLDFWVYQERDPRYPAVAYHHPSRSRDNGRVESGFVEAWAPPRDALERSLDLPGKQWHVSYQPAPAFLAAHPRHTASGVLVSGLVLTTMLGVYLVTQLRESRRAAVLNRRLAATNEDLQREAAERAGAERALVAKEELYRSLIEHAPEAITILDVEQGCFAEVNRQTEQLFGLSHDELLHSGPARLSPEFQPDGQRSDTAARDWIAQAVAGDTPVFEWVHRHADGEDIPCEIRLVRLPDTEGTLVRGTIVDIRERYKAEGLRERLGRILDNSTNEIYVFDASTLRFIQVNAGACANLGYDADDLVQMTPIDISSDFDAVRFRERLAPLLSGKVNVVRFSTRHKRKDGTTYPVEVSLNFSRQEVPQVFVAVVQDVSARLEAERALQESEAYNRMLFEESTIGLALCDMEGCLVDINPAFAAILGRTVEETLSLSFWDITPESYVNEERKQLETLERTGRYGPYEKEYIHKDGHLVPVRLTGRMLERAGKRYIWSSVEDISDFVAAHERIEHMAFHDALTDLPNRELLHDRLNHAINLANRSGSLVGVMFLDLDRFKMINDTLGHSVGDALLKQIAGRLTQNVRDADTVARFGGDEFVVIAEGVRDRHHLELLAGGIVDRMRRPFMVAGKEMFVTMSIGMALGPDAGSSAETLIAQADIAMYKAKDAGRNTFRLHSQGMGEQVSARAALESDLRGALDRDELLFHVQPIVDTETGRPTCMEALMRWQHPQRGLVSPGEFIPVMEETGMILPVTRWILQEACRYIAEVRRQTGQVLSIAVNFSAPCFCDADLAGLMHQSLSDNGLPGGALIVEITESTLFHDPQRVKPVLRALKDIGVLIALDDFGTGQSSLSHLRDYPIDIVKIDREFIRDIPHDDNDCELVSAIIAMAHNLQKRVVAEGVENEGQLSFLRGKGCERVQGYLLSPPMPQAQLNAYLSGVSAAQTASNA